MNRSMDDVKTEFARVDEYDKTVKENNINAALAPICYIDNYCEFADITAQMDLFTQANQF